MIALIGILAATTAATLLNWRVDGGDPPMIQLYLLANVALILLGASLPS